MSLQRNRSGIGETDESDSEFLIDEYDSGDGGSDRLFYESSDSEGEEQEEHVTKVRLVVLCCRDMLRREIDWENCLLLPSLCLSVYSNPPP